MYKELIVNESFEVLLKGGMNSRNCAASFQGTQKQMCLISLWSSNDVGLLLLCVQNMYMCGEHVCQKLLVGSD